MDALVSTGYWNKSFYQLTVGDLDKRSPGISDCVASTCTRIHTSVWYERRVWPAGRAALRCCGGLSRLLTGSAKHGPKPPSLESHWLTAAAPSSRSPGTADGRGRSPEARRPFLKYIPPTRRQPPPLSLSQEDREHTINNTIIIVGAARVHIEGLKSKNCMYRVCSQHSELQLSETN